jgi:sn-glycerol 3-phosphate transport system ATP-binding protein
MAAITLEAVGKSYTGGVKVVHSIDLAIEDGEFVVLVGPSGCGKSTLLRMVAGLETVTEGQISIGGRMVNEVEPAERDIAMVFQNYALYPHMTVRQNLAYGLKNRKMAKDEITRRVDEAAQILEIGAFLDRKPRALSGGQRQRVAMGRAIVREPAAFLFDEPLSNLDAKLRVQMRGEIKQLQARLGTTSIYVTHDQLEAMTLAHRLVVLNGGRIEQVGTPLEVYRKPASTFVAAFIGSPAMNLLEARAEGGVAHVGGGRVPLEAAVSGTVTLGLRPEDVRPVDAGTDGAFVLKLAYVEELGAQKLVHGTVEGHKFACALPSDALLGDELHLVPEPGAAHGFDAQSGKRLG